MYLETYETYKAVPDKKLKNKTVVVIDTLRTSSVITTALANGAKEIIPVVEIEDAIELARRLESNSFLVGGERNGAKIEGFDLSNSPLEYNSDIVKDKTVIITTTNGTKALKKASLSDDVIIGCLLNVSAVADYLFSKSRDIVIICAGTKGKFSIDDIITAGVIYDRLKNRICFDSDDLSKASYFLYKAFQIDILSILKESTSFSIMKKSGYKNDLLYCASMDMFNIVPKYEDGIVRL